MHSPARRLLAVFALVLVTAALLAPSAFAKAEEVAYTCDVDVCLADPDSFNSVVNLTNNGSKSYDEHPVWSPDGKKVAFVGGNPENEADRTQNIYVMEPGKGEASNIALKLTFYTGNVGGNDINYLAWSPDGTRIAYSRTANFGAHAGVFEVASDGTTATPLMLAADGYHPSWAPDGGKIAYSTYSEQIFTVNANGGGTAPLPGGEKGVEPAWSPDGSQIAFGKLISGSAYLDLHIVSAGCGASSVVVPLPYPTEYTQWIDASWAPDGSRLSYRSTHDNGYGYERIVGRYGGVSHGMVKVQNVNMGGGRAASWSPNGQRLSFDGYSSETTGREVYVGNEDGSGSVTAITTGGKNSEPSWRPDRLVTPYVPVICRTVPAATPGGNAGAGTGGPVPGAQRKPKLVWFTKRIPITASGPIHMMNVYCAAPDCGASTRGTSPKSAAPAGIRPRLAMSAKAKPKQKPIVVGSGKLKLREGQEKPLLMYLNKAGKELLKQQGKLDIQATVTVTSTGQAPVTARKTIHVVLKKPKSKKQR
jgi:Tol biopolymer transport system component